MLAKLLVRSFQPCWPSAGRASRINGQTIPLRHILLSAHALTTVRRIRPWTKEEDANLRALVQRFGEFNWTLVSKQMPGRDDRSCKARWDQSLCLTLKSSKWSAQVRPTLPSPSTQIHLLLPPSSPHSLTFALHPITLQEDEQLRNLVDKYGENFRQISEHMDGRTIVQLRMR